MLRLQSNKKVTWIFWGILLTSILLNILTFFEWLSLDCASLSGFHFEWNSTSAISPASLSGSSFICDYKKGTIEYPWIKNRSHPANKLKDYCSKIPHPTNNWKKAQKYKEHEVAFIIYTGASLYATRARAVRNTWASRVTHYYFLGSVPDSSLPITVIENVGEDYQSNTKKIFYALELVYKQQQSLESSQRYKWYILVGCDTYINVPYFLKQLEAYDYNLPYFIGGSVGDAVCYHKNGSTYKSKFVGGNTAHVFSAALVEALYPHLSVYIDSVWPQPNHPSAAVSDVALSCLIFSLGYNMTILPGFWRRSPKGIIHEFGLKQSLAVLEPSSWHYIHPAQMLDLDEFYLYQYVDRLTNDQNWMELVDFIRLFIGTHFETLRKNLPVDSHKLVRTYK